MVYKKAPVGHPAVFLDALETTEADMGQDGGAALIETLPRALNSTSK